MNWEDIARKKYGVKEWTFSSSTKPFDNEIWTGTGHSGKYLAKKLSPKGEHEVDTWRKLKSKIKNTELVVVPLEVTNDNVLIMEKITDYYYETDMLDAVLLLHQMGIVIEELEKLGWVHADICRSNCLLHEKGWKLCDFGNAFSLNRKDVNRTFRDHYAPEVNDKIYSPQMDTFALGMVAMEVLLTGQLVSAPGVKNKQWSNENQNLVGFVKDEWEMKFSSDPEESPKFGASRKQLKQFLELVSPLWALNPNDRLPVSLVVDTLKDTVANYVREVLDNETAQNDPEFGDWQEKCRRVCKELDIKVDLDRKPQSKPPKTPPKSEPTPKRDTPKPDKPSQKKEEGSQPAYSSPSQETQSTQTTQPSQTKQAQPTPPPKPDKAQVQAFKEMAQKAKANRSEAVKHFESLKSSGNDPEAKVLINYYNIILKDERSKIKELPAVLAPYVFNISDSSVDYVAERTARYINYEFAIW